MGKQKVYETKETIKERILYYLSNPDNPYPTREYLATEVLGYGNVPALYYHFSPDEIQALEKEALAIRRAKYAPALSRIDTALIKEAEDGNTKAIELAYKRFEGWMPGEKREITGADGQPIQQEIEIGPSKAAKLLLERIARHQGIKQIES